MSENKFTQWRKRLMGLHDDTVIKTQTPEDSTDKDYHGLLKEIMNTEDDYDIGVDFTREGLLQPVETIEKGLDGKATAYSEPILGGISMNPDYKTKANTQTAHPSMHTVLRSYANNVIFNAIVNTRANQVSLYTRPARYSERGQGFQVRMKDYSKKPGAKEENELKRIEDFLLNTGRTKDTSTDNFTGFIKKIVRDTFTYDQVNFEKVFDENGNLLRFVAVDPSTIYFGTDDNGRKPNGETRYVQVLDGKVETQFTQREMAFAVRNPRSDIYGMGYGYSELEMTLKELKAQENTERFNDRFFSHGGTTRGVLHIKQSDMQSQSALEMFKKEWKTNLSGINGSWQIPVVNAEDVKFVNMTPSARDMEKHLIVVSEEV